MTTANPRREMTGDVRTIRRRKALPNKKLRIAALATATLSACVVGAAVTASAAAQTATISDPPNYASPPAGYYDYASPQIPALNTYDPTSSGGGSWGYNQSLNENK